MQPGDSPFQSANIRIWLVEDSPDYTESISFLLNSLTGLSITNTFISVEAGLEKLKVPYVSAPDVILLDHWLETGMDGIDGLRLLKNALPEIPILILTSHDDTDLIVRALQNGASGYLLKELQLDEIAHSIRQAIRGGVYIPPGVAHKILGIFRKAPPSQKYDLTERETEVLQHLSRGYKQQKIADTLFISRKTVDNHLRHIYQKLHVNSGIEAVAKAYEEGLVNPSK